MTSGYEGRRLLWVPVEGPCEVVTGDPFVVSRERIGACEVWSCRNGGLRAEGAYVMWVDEWGAVRQPLLPVNFRAWALYGGSPIRGDALLGEDDGDVSAAVAAWISDPDFPGPQMLELMQKTLHERNP